jgi:hypothetical protein
MLDPLLSDQELSRVTGRAVSTLQKDRVAGRGIPFIRLGRLIRYRQSDVCAYLASLPSHRSTSELDQHERGSLAQSNPGASPLSTIGKTRRPERSRRSSAEARKAHDNQQSARGSME